jgi:endonuclease YncB( thermonuclease family)
VIACIACAVASLIYADARGWLLAPRTCDISGYHGVRVNVLRIIDGHTFEIDMPDVHLGREITRIRLWGVRSPRPPDEPLAYDAMQFAQGLLQVNDVVLRLDSQRTRDPLGAILAHVHLSGEATLNEALLEAGLAVIDERRPHVMLTAYAQAQNKARRRGTGLWASE